MIRLERFTYYFFGLLRSAIRIILALLLLIVLGGLVMAPLEKLSIWNSLYLAFNTALTIGYGDPAPSTSIGKIICIFLGVIGLVFMGLVVAASIKAMERSSKEKGK